MKLQEIRALFSPGTDPADTLLLVSRLLGIPKARLLALTNDELPLTNGQMANIKEAAAKSADGIPLPYILGEWDFYGRSFNVNPHVLIPRPETELIVEQALAWLRTRSIASPRIVDVGCGSGILPVTFACELANSHCLAIDISPDALETTRQNAIRHAILPHLELCRSDLLPPDFPAMAPYDILTANLPYIPTQTLHGLDVYGKEPTLALDGGADGLVMIRRLLEQIARLPYKVRLCLLEMESSQGAALLEIAEFLFPAADVAILKDLAGFDRILRIEQEP